MSRGTCPQCGFAKPERYSLCWQCHVRELQAAAYTEGFAQGFEKGKAEAPQLAREALDLKRVRQLLQLSHPDRHDNSRAATEATRWLLRQRDLLESSST